MNNDEDIEGQEDFLTLAQVSPLPHPDDAFQKVKDYSKTILKGTVEGLGRFGKIMGPLQHPHKTQEQELEEQTENLNKFLPVEKEDFGQKAIRRGLKEAPTTMAFPGAPLQALPRAMVAGFLGETGKELGLPEWGQNALELTAFIGPDITKKLLSSGKDKELIDFAKKMGMTDEQITPLLQSEFKQKWLAKISPKRGRGQSALKSSKGALDEVNINLQESSNASKEISERANGKLINDIKGKLSDLPREVQGKIEADLNDLLNNKITGKSLINFWRDINKQFGNAKELGVLKPAIKEALNSISPELGKDFELLNNLYSRYFPLAEKLKPTVYSDIINAGETIGLLGSLAMGNYPVMLSFIGEKSGKLLAREMLINPRFQQLGRKTIEALNANKYEIAKKLADEYANLISQYSPKAAKELKKLSIDEIKEFLQESNRKEETEEE